MTQPPTQTIKIPSRGATIDIDLTMGLLYKVCSETQYGLQEILGSLEILRLDIMADALAAILRETIPDITGEAVISEYGVSGLIEAWQKIGVAFNVAFADLIVEDDEGNAGGASEPLPAASSA